MVLSGLMSFYFFVDSGRSRQETLVLTQRLILPASAFLLLGYADLVAAIADRLHIQTIVRWATVVLSPTLVLLISLRHHVWQAPMHDALEAADQVVSETGQRVLGTTVSAMKVALLHNGPVVLSDPSRQDPRVVLCNTVDLSYRASSAVSCVKSSGFRLTSVLPAQNLSKRW